MNSFKYNIFFIMIICLTITIIFELLGAFILKIKDKKDVLNIILVNILTNPLLVSITWLIGLLYGNFTKNILTYILEIFVVIIEGFIYKKTLTYKKINPYSISLILNSCSYLLGSIINYIY